jgi:hypothetical protein
MFKQGSSHVEYIISFLLFISFVSVTLFLFIPNSDPDLSKSSLVYLVDRFESKTSTEVASFFVSVDVETMLNDGAVVVEIDFDKIPNDSNLRVENKERGVIESRIGGGSKVEFSWKDDLDGSDSDLFVIMFGKDLPENNGNPKGKKNRDAGIVVSSIGEFYLFEGNLLDLKAKYDKDYDSLKETEFDILGIEDFSFEIRFSDNEKIEAIQNIPEGVDVFSVSDRVPVLRNKPGKEGERVFAEVQIRKW